MTQAVVLDEGIPGFGDARNFEIRDCVEDGVFQILACRDDPDLMMAVAVPWRFFPDYAPQLSELDRVELGINGSSDASVWCPITLDGAGRTAFMNLRAPLVVNRHTWHGRQIVLTDQDYPLRAVVPINVNG